MYTHTHTQVDDSDSAVVDPNNSAENEGTSKDKICDSVEGNRNDVVL